MQQHDDEADPRFFALLMSVLAATIVHVSEYPPDDAHQQVPKALLPFQDEAPIDIATRCIRASRAVSVMLYDPPSLAMIIRCYFDSVFSSLTGQPGAWGETLRYLPISLMYSRCTLESQGAINPAESASRVKLYRLE